MCLNAQGGIKAKRQPFVVGVSLEVMLSWTWSERWVVVNILSDVGSENNYKKKRRRNRSDYQGETDEPDSAEQQQEEDDLAAQHDFWSIS